MTRTGTLNACRPNPTFVECLHEQPCPWVLCPCPFGRSEKMVQRFLRVCLDACRLQRASHGAQEQRSPMCDEDLVSPNHDVHYCEVHPLEQLFSFADCKYVCL